MAKIEKAKKEKILIAALGVVFLFILAVRFIKPDEMRREGFIPDKSGELQRKPAEKQSTKKRQIIEYTGAEVRDPFQVSPELLSALSQLSSDAGQKETSSQGDIAASEIAASLDLSLQGIVWGKEPPRAIINGRVLKKGDEISGIKIIDIQKERVRLLYQGRESSITFQEGE